MGQGSRIKKILIVVGVVIVIAAVFSFLRTVFSGQIILPQTLHLGPLSIRYYGIFIALGAGLGYWSALHRAKKFNISGYDADKILLVIIICGFIGARIYHVFSDYN